jgi:hypothetical protein
MMNMDDQSSDVGVLKPKGHAIPGLDYGIDMIDEAPPANQASGSEGSGSIEQKSAHMQPARPQVNFSKPQMTMGRPQFNFQNQMRPQRQMQEESLGASYSEGGDLYQQMANSGMSMQEDDESGGLLAQGFQIPGMSMSEEQEPPPLTYEQRRQRKIDALASLRRLEEAGYVPSGDKKYSFSSDLAEIEEVVERLKLQRDLDSSIKFQRKFLIGFANVVEFVCSTEFNVFDLKLEGWSDSIFENITDYDEVFEELYYKYKDSVAVLPEVKLVMMVGGSAMMYHMSREIFSKTSSKVPGFDEVMSRDPDLKRRYTDAAAGIAKERGMPIPSKNDGGADFLRGMIDNLKPGATGAGAGAGPQRGQHRPPPQQRQPPSRAPVTSQRSRGGPTRVPMSDPDDVDGLLGSLTGGGRSSRGIPDEIDLSEIENLSDLA